MNEDRELKGLQFFLIKTFVLTMVVATMAEYGVTVWIDNTMMPFIMNFFFEGQDAGEVTLLGILYAFVLVFAMLILEMIRTVVPGSMHFLLSQAIGSIRMGLGGEGEETTALSMGPLKELLLLLCLLVMLLLLLLPLVIAAIHVSRIVIREVKKISLERQKKQREYEQKRNLMLSDIAHDLRTPITTVSGYARALSDGLVEKGREQEYLDAIMTKSERMSDLINYLFDYVKTDSASFTLHREMTDICEMVRECVALMYQDFEDAGMEIEVDIPEQPCPVMADRLQLSRCITNLLTNAVRHNDAGCRIGALFQKDEDGAAIMIADSGKVIPDETAEHLFEPFVMGDESRSSRGGSGLGLSIAKKIVELHGFTIRLLQQNRLPDNARKAGFEKAFVIRIPDRLLV